MISVLALAGMIAFLVMGGPSSAIRKNAAPFRSADGSENVPEKFLDVRSMIMEILDGRETVSIAVAAAEDGKIVWEEGFGWADREKGIRASHNTIYHLASISKSITATGLMVLVQRGLVDLDRPANDYLGKSKLIAFAGDARDATVKRILFHTAGLPMHWNLFDLKGPLRRPDMDESIRRYGILVTAPGEEYNYSNFGYGIIDYIISRASGMDYSDFMKAEVFEPLGMSRTSVLADPDLMDQVAQMYEGGQQRIPPYDFDHRGASAVLSTAHDLARYGMFHLKNRLPDQEAILKDETIDRLHKETDPRFPDLRELIGFDCLLGSFGRVDTCGYRLEMTTGSMPGASTRMALVPSENVVTVVLCNEADIDSWRIEKKMLGSMIPGLSEAFEREEGESPREKSAMSSIPPKPFIGSWSGEITTYSGTIPVSLKFGGGGEVEMLIGGAAAPRLNVRTPLGEMGFRDGLFRGLFMGGIDTPDAARAPHVVLVECRPRNGRLTGYAAAVAMNKRFCLPYWMELSPGAPEAKE